MPVKRVTKVTLPVDVRSAVTFESYTGRTPLLLTWGDEHYSADGPRRTFGHAADDATVASDGICTVGGSAVPLPDLVLVPGPG